MSIFRDYLVNLLLYMPEHLTKDRETVSLLLAESEEHNLQEEWLKEIFAQFFIETATWGLAKYENDYGLVANPGDTYQQRRNRIYLKLQRHQTSNKEFLRKLAERYFSEDAIIEAEEDNPHDAFIIYDKGGQLLYPDDFFEAIDTYIPAHIGLTFQIEREIPLTGEDSIKYGLANIVDGMVNIGLPRPPDLILPYNAEAFTGSAGRRIVGAGPVELSAKLSEEIIFAYINSGYADIPANMEDLPEWIRSITKPARILHKIGTGFDRKGRHRIPIALPEAAIVNPFPVILGGKTGGRLYGLATPEPGRQCVQIGHTAIITGRGRLEPDYSDLAEWIKDIREPSRAAVRIAIETMRQGRRTYPMERPPDAIARILTGAAIQATGSSTIGIDPEDLPDFMRGFLQSSRAAPQYGISTTGRGTRRLFLALPTEAEIGIKAGAKITEAGKRNIFPALPEALAINTPVGGAGLRVGRVTVGYGIEGLPRDFWSLTEPSVACPGIHIKTVPKGITRIGTGQRIEEAITSLPVGFFNARTGRAEISIEDSDLPETYRDILEAAVITPRIAAKVIGHGTKTVHGSRPQDAEILAGAGFGEGRGGVKSIGIDPEDLPDFMRGFLKSSRAAPRYGLKTFSHGTKHLYPAIPPEGKQPVFTGLATGVTGTIRITPKRPEKAVSGFFLGNAYTITGRVIIGADRGDLPPRKRMRAHVGVMQAGLSQIG